MNKSPINTNIQSGSGTTTTTTTITTAPTATPKKSTSSLSFSSTSVNNTAQQQQQPIYPPTSNITQFAPFDQYLLALTSQDHRTRVEAILYLQSYHLPLNNQENGFDLVYTVKKQLSSEQDKNIRVQLVGLLKSLALDPFVESTSIIHYLLSTVIKNVHTSKKVICASLIAIRSVVQSKNLKLSLLISSSIQPLLNHPNPLIRKECILIFGHLVKTSEELDEIQMILVNFLRDPDFRVREASLRSLSLLFYRCHNLSINKIYQQATLLLVDSFEQVRLECIKLLWIFSNVFPNHILGTINDRKKSDKIRLVDDVFKKICNAVNDPSVVVRNCACKLLGCIYDVSLHYLIQTLSKEILFDHDNKGRKKFQIGHSRYSNAGKNQKQQQQQVLSPLQQQLQQQQHQQQQQQQYTTIQVPEGDIDFMASTDSSLSLVDAGATGAFIQGLEDEFYEVRSSAIDSMCELSLRNNEFAQKNIDFLVDIFTDEIESVRINSINSLRKIGKTITIKEDQLHIILASLDNSSQAERQAIHRLLTTIHLTNFSCLHATVQALLVNLQKYPRDMYSIFECLYKVATKNQFTEFIAEDLLRIDSKFASVEPNMDDIFYVAIMIVILNSAKNNNTILSLLPPYWVQHHLYFKDKYPAYFQQNIITTDTNNNVNNYSLNSTYEMKLKSQEDLTLFLKNTLSMLYGSNNGNDDSLYSLLKVGKFDQLSILMEEIQRNLLRISNINRILKPTSDFYLMFIKVLKIIIHIKKELFSSSNSQQHIIAEKLIKTSFKMQGLFIGLDNKIQSILYEIRLYGTIVLTISKMLNLNDPSPFASPPYPSNIFTNLQSSINIYKTFFKDNLMTIPEKNQEIMDTIGNYIIEQQQSNINQRPFKMQRTGINTRQLLLDKLIIFLKEYQLPQLMIQNQIKKKVVNTLMPPFEKPIESFDNLPIKLVINANIENISNVEYLYLQVNYLGKSQLYTIGSQYFVPIKPLSYSICLPIYVSLPKSQKQNKEMVQLTVNIIEIVPIDPYSTKILSFEHINEHFKLVNLRGNRISFNIIN
ncbi:HEAT repeat-containing protein [Cavenderia fasciculata]|uniref:HEAT repeat-containing protein n=1 Tax=Cavenderia fasciculata TaxID=261658 RepID=F4PL58_CACFS|nr:HEAT repeat-containing protein [Cavenderia fasciculata]EGG23280.1 HEAT repeat-containing protein [Cavenderia fasciculata]|eukprot:XP_004361131.1 HEAT repeat-containing protein [Cavenderia fasciculata]